MSLADWDRLQFYSRRVKFVCTYDYANQVHPSTYVRIAQLQSRSSPLFPSLRRLEYHLYTKCISKNSNIFLFLLSPLLDSLELSNIRGFESTIVGPFLATLSSSPRMLRRIVLHSGRMPVDILKESIVHFKQLQYLDLSVEIFMGDFVLWEVLGTLPSLAQLTLKAIDPASHPAHAPENSNSQSRGPYFDALESLEITGSFFFIQHLLGFIDSPRIETIRIHPIIKHILNEHDHEPDNLLSLSVTIVASKWSRSLKLLAIDLIDTSQSSHRFAISKSLTFLMDLHEMKTLLLSGWRLDNVNDDVRRLVMSCPKLRVLSLRKIPISLSALKIVAERCPDLQELDIYLDASTIPPFDASSESLGHKLEILTVRSVHSSLTQISLESQIQIARHLDSFFPYLKTITVWSEKWSWIRELCRLCQNIRLGK